jgi:hypothetical protein
MMGSNEVSLFQSEAKVQIREMSTGEQQTIDLKDAILKLK